MREEINRDRLKTETDRNKPTNRIRDIQRESERIDLAEKESEGERIEITDKEMKRKCENFSWPVRLTAQGATM